MMICAALLMDARPSAEAAMCLSAKGNSQLATELQSDRVKRASSAYERPMCALHILARLLPASHLS